MLADPFESFDDWARSCSAACIARNRDTLAELGASWETFERDEDRVARDLYEADLPSMLAARDVVHVAAKQLRLLKAQATRPLAVLWDMESVPLDEGEHVGAVLAAARKRLSRHGRVERVSVYVPSGDVLSAADFVALQQAGAQIVDRAVVAGSEVAMSFLVGVDAVAYAMQRPEGAAVALITNCAVDEMACVLGALSRRPEQWTAVLVRDDDEPHDDVGSIAVVVPLSELGVRLHVAARKRDVYEPEVQVPSVPLPQCDVLRCNDEDDAVGHNYAADHDEAAGGDEAANHYDHNDSAPACHSSCRSASSVSVIQPHRTEAAPAPTPNPSANAKNAAAGDFSLLVGIVRRLSSNNAWGSVIKTEVCAQVRQQLGTTQQMRDYVARGIAAGVVIETRAGTTAALRLPYKRSTTPARQEEPSDVRAKLPNPAAPRNVPLPLLERAAEPESQLRSVPDQIDVRCCDDTEVGHDQATDQWATNAELDDSAPASHFTGRSASSAAVVQVQHTDAVPAPDPKPPNAKKGDFKLLVDIVRRLSINHSWGSVIKSEVCTQVREQLGSTERMRDYVARGIAAGVVIETREETTTFLRLPDERSTTPLVTQFKLAPELPPAVMARLPSPAVAASKQRPVICAVPRELSWPLTEGNPIATAKSVQAFYSRNQTHTFWQFYSYASAKAAFQKLEAFRQPQATFARLNNSPAD
jgi:hypothetical protein